MSSFGLILYGIFSYTFLTIMTGFAFFLCYGFTFEIFRDTDLTSHYKSIYESIVVAVAIINTTIVVHNFNAFAGMPPLGLSSKKSWVIFSVIRTLALLVGNTLLFVLGSGNSEAWFSIIGFDITVLLEEMWIMISGKSKWIFLGYILIFIGLKLRFISYEEGVDGERLKGVAFILFMLAYWSFAYQVILL